MTRADAERDPEIVAIEYVYAALRDLDPGSRARVLDYVSRKLGVSASEEEDRGDDESESGTRERQPAKRDETEDDTEENSGDGGISPIAAKWIKRSGFSASDLGTIFSVDGDEIDLIATKVPGNSKQKRVRSVVLLKGIAAYLGSGTARITHERLIETLTHYGAYQKEHFPVHIKRLSSEVSGTRESGYTLSPRGIEGAKALIEEILKPSKNTAR